MIQDGIYRIYKLWFDEAGETHRKLDARLHFEAGQCKHLEDHHAIDEMFPEGPVTPVMERRLTQLKHSGYHEVIHEKDIAEGHHDSEVDALDLGDAEAEHKFIMTGEGVAQPALVHLWDHRVEVDGRTLDEAEAQQLLHEVAGGRITLTPLD